MAYLAVIDVETTGLNPYRHDRVIELAAVILGLNGEIIREFVTLINPERDIGPTSIHGLTQSDILSAPRFADIAGPLLDMLNGCVVLAGHNIRFDHSFLSAEFERLGITFPNGPTLCTMNLAGGGTLSSCCDDYGISFEGDKHAALNDARATARLLASVLQDAPGETSRLMHMSPITWPTIPKCPVRLLTRDVSRERQSEPPTYLQKLFARAANALVPNTDDSVTLAYTALLDRALEDRYIDDTEASSLLDLASRWGIPGHSILELHQKYLLQLAGVALGDGVVSDSERHDLHRAAYLLGLSSKELDAILKKASSILSQQPMPTQRKPEPSATGRQLTGFQVCFTGEFQCRHAGRLISREIATDLAMSRGVNVVETVTKKLDILVVADPLSQSGKAKKGRKYGIRIMQEAVFWNALGIETE